MSQEIHHGENYTETDGVEVFPPDVVEPNSASSGNVPPATPPPPEEQFYSYELDIADTDLVWSVGSPIDTGMVRQYIVDRGYEAVGVDAQTDASGLPTGFLTVRSNAVGVQIYPDVEVLIEDATESNTTAIVTAATKIASTAIATLPANATFSGTLRFAANVWRAIDTGDMGIVPIVAGVDGSFTSVAGSLTPAPVYVDIDVSALVGGTAPTFGLKFRGNGTTGTTYISDAVIGGQLVDGVETPAAEITAPHWADYNGTRFTGLVETIIVWDDTAEGVITPNPDLPRIAQLWQYLEQNDYEIAQITGYWNFTTPDAAPAIPEFRVYARSAIDTAVSDAYLYTEIRASDLDAFQTQWSAVEELTTITRNVSGAIAVNQYEFSFPAYFFQGGEPTGDVRNDDIWDDTDLPIGSRRYLRTAGAWVEAFDLVVTNQGSLGIGRGIQVLNARTTVIGQNATGSGDASVAIGRYNVASGYGANAIGNQAVASGSGANAIGNQVVASGYGSTAIGTLSTASGDTALSIGDVSLASGVSSIGLGAQADASATGALAIGVSSQASGGASIALGYLSEASGSSAVAIGTQVNAAASTSIAIGANSSVESTSLRSIALGYNADVPAAAYDTMYLRINKVRQYPSGTSGATTYVLLSPDGTDGEIAVTNTDGLTVNGTDVGSASVATHAALTTAHGSSGTVVGATTLAADIATHAAVASTHGASGNIVGATTMAVAIATPTITDFINAQHDHTDAASGGVLEVTATLENYFTVGTFGLTTSIGTQIDAIASTSVALGSGTKELVLTVGGLLARSVTTGGALVLPRLDGANLAGSAPYAYTKSPLTALDYTPVFRQFVVSGVSSGSHNLGLQFRGDNTAGDTYLTNAFVYITSRVTG